MEIQSNSRGERYGGMQRTVVLRDGSEQPIHFFKNLDCEPVSQHAPYEVNENPRLSEPAYRAEIIAATAGEGKTAEDRYREMLAGAIGSPQAETRAHFVDAAINFAAYSGELAPEQVGELFQTDFLDKLSEHPANPSM